MPPQYAEHAENIDVASGRFQPWQAPLELVRFPHAVGRVHVRDCCWHGVADPDARYHDAGVCEKTYLSVPGCPVLVTDSLCDPVWTRLGYPVPDAPVVVPDPNVEVCDGPDAERRTYRLTYANDCEEGPASCATDAVKAFKGSRFGLMLPEPPGPEWGITHVNVYRSQSLWNVEQGLVDFSPGAVDGGYPASNGDQDWFLVARLPITQRMVMDEPGLEIGGLLRTEYLLPPVEGARMAGETTPGSLVVWHDRTVWFSERNKYWGFPLRTAHDFAEAICDVQVCGATVFVLTTRGAYVIPDDADCKDSTCRPVYELKGAGAPQHPVSSVVFAGGLLYAGRDGLYHIEQAGRTRDGDLSAGQVRRVSDNAFDKATWQEWAPFSIEATGCNQLVVRSHDKCWLWPLSFDEAGRLPPDLTSLSEPAEHWTTDAAGTLYYLWRGTVFQFDAAPHALPMDWWQVEQRHDVRTLYSAVSGEYVKKDTPSFNSLFLYRDGRLSVRKMLTGKAARVRGSRSRCSQIRIKGTEPMCHVGYGSGLSHAVSGRE